jgi:predicted nucleic-acid-binding Zn-ribbon protein
MPASPSCRKCGSQRTKVVGQSAVPAGILVRCTACGYSSLVAADDSDPEAAGGNLDTRRVERLVRTVVDDKQMRCELQGVVRTPAGWRITALVDQRDVVRFDLKAAGFAAMRAEIERALAAT